MYHFIEELDVSFMAIGEIKKRTSTPALIMNEWSLDDREKDHMLKVLISYDMQNGKEQECQDYFVNKFAPGLAKMGFRIADVWYTMWGDAPQILSGGIVDSTSHAQKIFQSSPWEKLVDGMTPLTENFKVRFIDMPEQD